MLIISDAWLDACADSKCWTAWQVSTCDRARIRFKIFLETSSATHSPGQIRYVKNGLRLIGVMSESLIAFNRRALGVWSCNVSFRTFSAAVMAN